MKRSSTLRRLAGAGVLAVVLTTSACGGSPTTGADPEGTGTPSPSSIESADAASTGARLEIQIAADGSVTPKAERVPVKVGEKVTLAITAKADEEIHVHSDPEHEYEVKKGESVEKSFTVDVPGQVAVEAHGSDTTIAQLVVTS